MLRSLAASTSQELGNRCSTVSLKAILYHLFFMFFSLFLVTVLGVYNPFSFYFLLLKCPSQWLDDIAESTISPIGIDVTVPWSSVCLSVSCIVLTRQKISSRFLLHTTAPCLSQISLKFGLHRSTVLPQIFSKVIYLCWFERQRHSIPNFGRLVRESAMVTDWLIEHGFTSATTQYRLYGQRFLQVWWPN